MTTFGLICNLEELWAIHAMVRFPAAAPDYSREIGQRLAVDVFAGITSLETAKLSEDWILWATDEELWWISRLIPKDYSVGMAPVGRQLLVKVMDVLVQIEREGQDAYDDRVPGGRSAGASARADSGNVAGA